MDSGPETTRNDSRAPALRKNLEVPGYGGLLTSFATLLGAKSSPQAALSGKL